MSANCSLCGLQTILSKPTALAYNLTGYQKLKCFKDTIYKNMKMWITWEQTEDFMTFMEKTVGKFFKVLDKRDTMFMGYIGKVSILTE